MPQQFPDAETIADAIIAKVGKSIVLALPLGLGKANHISNAFTVRAVADKSINLKILTALTLEKPVPQSELSVHARTRQQGYAPPVYWDELGRIRERIKIPLIANGDICTVEDYHRCVAESGTTDVMLGRGAVRQPSLAMQIRANETPAPQWTSIQPLLVHF